MRTTRLEAFSDGVLAIIITVMVLELPRPEGHDWHALHHLWPTLLSYLVSFVFVGIYWNNHHHMLAVVSRIDGRVMWMNLLLLFCLSLLPYVTGWAGESHFAPVPMTCYALVALASAVSFTLLRLAAQACDPANDILRGAAATGSKEKLSVALYSGAVVAPVFGEPGAVVSGLLLIVVAGVWLLPDRRIERALTAREDTLPAE